MARLIAGVGTSHVPSIGVAFDQNEQEAPEWKPLFDGYKPAKAWLKEAGVTHAIVLYNDHGTDFFFDKYPTFGLRTGFINLPPPQRACGSSYGRRI